MVFKKNIGILAIVAASLPAGGFAWVGKTEADKLVKAGEVEINPALKNEQDASLVAARATAAAIEKYREQAIATANDAPAATETKQKSEFVIEDNVPMPETANRGRAGAGIYPFDKLQKGQSFFVAKDAKALGSTVSSANARFAEEIPGQTRVNRKGETVPATRQLRKFAVKPVEGGARIWRVE